MDQLQCSLLEQACKKANHTFQLGGAGKISIMLAVTKNILYYKAADRYEDIFEAVNREISRWNFTKRQGQEKLIPLKHQEKLEPCSSQNLFI